MLGCLVQSVGVGLGAGLLAFGAVLLFGVAGMIAALVLLLGGAAFVAWAMATAGPYDESEGAEDA